MDKVICKERLHLVNEAHMAALVQRTKAQGDGNSGDFDKYEKDVNRDADLHEAQAGPPQNVEQARLNALRRLTSTR